MEAVVASIITAIITLAGSSGLWGYITHVSNKKDVKTELLLGLAHEKIFQVGTVYIHRGYITKEQHDDLHKYLYNPYKKAGGNGSAEKLMADVDRLPYYEPVFPAKHEIADFRKEKE